MKNDFPFHPGTTTSPIFKDWGERTVDQQRLDSILEHFRLQVNGLVESPQEYTFEELTKLKRINVVADFHCVEGWSIYDVPWNGVHLSVIFDRIKPLPSATHVVFHTIGGNYNESLPLPVALEPKTLLVYGIDGNPLPLKHGFPLRLVVPRLLAYKHPKYVERIELTDKPLAGFWVTRGYSYDGEVPKHRLRKGKY